VPASVADVLRSPGRPLDSATRAYFEPRFGHDFSRVRVHTDTRAAESAREVHSLAYVVGQDIVFGSGQYAPATPSGRRLLAHELAHVVQQGEARGLPRTLSRPSDPLELAAEATARLVTEGRAAPAVAELRGGTRAAAATPRLFRRIARRMMHHCGDADVGAPADPFAVLTDLDQRAGQMAHQIAADLATQAQLLRSPGAARNPLNPVQQAHEARFGVPPAVTGGFLNRLTGTTAPTLERAISEELSLLAARYRLLHRMFSQWMHYVCLGPGGGNFAGCAPPNCHDVFAWSCAGVGAIFLCPDFWNSADLDTVQSDDQQASVLVHEGGHINWERVRANPVGGSGGNFRIADCYSSFVADALGFPPLDDTCPAPPGP